MKTRIYVLCEPDGEIRYIGKTTAELVDRLLGHFKDARLGIRNYRCNWLRSVLSLGYLPIICLIGEVAGDGSKEERAWISYGKTEGWRLTNSTDGGEGIPGYKFTEEQKKRLSARKNHFLGKHLSEATKKKISLANTGRVPSTATRRKLSLARKGLKRSEETCRKISEARKGILFSKETRAKLSFAQTGRYPSEETRRRMSEAQLARQQEKREARTQETR